MLLAANPILILSRLSREYGKIDVSRFPFILCEWTPQLVITESPKVLLGKASI